MPGWYKQVTQDHVCPYAILTTFHLSDCTDPTYSQIDKECYKYLNMQATTWDQAARACNENNGTLPIISDAIATGNDYQLTIWTYFQRWRFYVGLECTVDYCISFIPGWGCPNRTMMFGLV